MLIEPQREFEPDLRAICARYDGEYHLVGAAEHEGNLTFHQRDRDLTGSSFRVDTAQEAARSGRIRVADVVLPLKPLDSFSDRSAPFLVKINTEGFERNVLKGARQILGNCQRVLLEVAVQPRHEGEASLGDLSSLLGSHDSDSSTSRC